MMQKNTKKRGAILSAAVMIGIAGLYLTVILSAMVSESFGSLAAALFVLVFIAAIGGIIWGILAALGQRLREIDSGEEEAARKY